ncbi:MAG TPA: heterodisulfide reductase-related iron-sulfur binding cluster [Alphaproteobacteria bacterium]|nr:heterodisulfide reductase-related iron-sulfur binding cluster [Alphaproteobacteria bacterium]
MSVKEGSTEAPTRHAIPWQDPAFTDPGKIDTELRRVFDICHGCRRCFNLCDSFPRLFDLIDESESGELDSVASSSFGPVIDACTRCDMCFMTKCPYVPPHEFDLDFPHLMLRVRAAEAKAGKIGFFDSQLARTDRNGRLAGAAPGLANWGSNRNNRLTRNMLESVAGMHHDAELPKYTGKTFEARAKAASPEVADAPARSRKAVLYATCFVNYNNPGIGEAAQYVLARNGVETEVVYPECCGMPQLEKGEIGDVAGRARRIAAVMMPWIDKGYDIIALTPSCALMLKFEWPLIAPDEEDVRRLSEATRDITEYVVDIARTEGLAEGLSPLEGGISVHLACHARAQNMGPKAAVLLRLIPATEVTPIERCSGHGGSWGIKKDNFEVALKVGRPAARSAVDKGAAFFASECPLAGKHIVQGMEKLEGEAGCRAWHPIELFARAYGFRPGGESP